ncbi:hypothetical protein BC629DRAFT_1531365 [Irpex lacteus]|nr:hypothetical protein BC629DRAFT_1531365 [Irpex lacteus]
MIIITSAVSMLSASPSSAATISSFQFSTSMPVPWSTRVLSALRSLWITLATDNPLTWSRNQGRRNSRADMEDEMRILRDVLGKI